VLRSPDLLNGVDVARIRGVVGLLAKVQVDTTRAVPATGRLEASKARIELHIKLLEGAAEARGSAQAVGALPEPSVLADVLVPKHTHQFDLLNALALRKVKER